MAGNPQKWPRSLLWAGLTLVLIVACGGLSSVLGDLFGPSDHPPGYDRLMSAIESKDAKVVESVLKSGVNPNVYPNTLRDMRREEDLAPINAAASIGSTAIVRLLLDHGADPNQADGWNSNPLCAATGPESIETMDLLVKRGAVINDEPGGSSALWRAAMDDRVRAVRFLLDRGANPRTWFHTTHRQSLVDALRDVNGSPEIIALLRAHGAR